MTAVYLIIIGIVSGTVSGMGIGGGTVLIPALTILFSFSQPQAQIVNLIYFIPTSIVALIIHFKNGDIEKEIVLRIVIFGVLSACAGAFLAVWLEADYLRRMFGLFLLYMGISELLKAKRASKDKELDNSSNNGQG